MASLRRVTFKKSTSVVVSLTVLLVVAALSRINHLSGTLSAVAETTRYHAAAVGSQFTATARQNASWSRGMFFASKSSYRLIFSTNEEEAEEVKDPTSSNRSAATVLPFGERTIPLVGSNNNTKANSTRSDLSISACIHMMDDRIKLIEWLAYHYTVLPLRNLMVGLDPKSEHVDEVTEILDRYKGLIAITIVNNDTYGFTDPTKGWGRTFQMSSIATMTEAQYTTKVFQRNERAFHMHCIQDSIRRKLGWTWVGDLDEYLTPNYISSAIGGTNETYEQYNLFDTYGRKPRRRQRIKDERNATLPLRRQLPPFSERVTIAEIISNYTQNPIYPHCIRFVDLRFSGYFSSNERYLPSNLPYDWINPRHLTTLQHLRHGTKAGHHIKSMLNTKYIPMEKAVSPILHFKTVHVPNRLYCEDTDGKDYIASLLRINHYVTGTLEMLLARRSFDYRYNQSFSATQNALTFFRARNFEPIGVNNDVVGWIEWFVELVGKAEAQRLLLEPLAVAYKRIDTAEYTEVYEELNKYVNESA